MLGPPEKSLEDRDVPHKVNVGWLADWMEGSITFDDDVISQYDVVDFLGENFAGLSQDDASAAVSEAWLEMRHRRKCLGKAATFNVKGHTVVRTAEWTDSPAYAFCLVLSLQTFYRTDFEDYKDYPGQGALFERVTARVLDEMGWEVHLVGWSKGNSVPLQNRVDALAAGLGEAARPDGVLKWSTIDAKDVGLDVVCAMRFPDKRPGRPILLIQCASGQNWKNKRHTPDISTWNEFIEFTTRPARGLSMPFVERGQRYKRAAKADNLMLLLDRHRLMVPHRQPSAWLTADLFADLTAWVEKRVEPLLATAS